MILSEFNQPASQKIAKMNNILREQFGVSVKTNYPNKKKLEKVLETANLAVIKLRTSNKKFQLDADYAKFLGIKDIVETMLEEGMYAESASYRAMKQEMTEMVCRLMDMGYSDEEAVAECMNKYRLDSRFAFDDDHVKGLLVLAAKDYLEKCASPIDEADVDLGPVRRMDPGLSISNPTEIENEIIEMHNNGADLYQIAQAMGLDPDTIENYLGAMGLGGTLDEAWPEWSKKVGQGIKNAAINTGKAMHILPYSYSVEFNLGGKHSNAENKYYQGIVAQDMKSAVAQAIKLHRAKYPQDSEEKLWASASCSGETLDSDVYEDDTAPDENFEDAQFYPGSILIRLASGDVVAEVYQDGDKWENYIHFTDAGTGRYNSKEFAVHKAMQEVSKFTDEMVLDPLGTHLTDSRVNLGHLLQEEVDVEQAEVVMAVRALADDLQDQVERLGRMINEEVPAIADQIRGEMGANEAQSFYDQMSQIINAQLENTRNAKTEMDTVVAQLSGEAPIAPDMTAPALATNSVASAPPPEEDSMDVNEPAAAGPVDAPLGRAKV